MSKSHFIPVFLLSAVAMISHSLVTTEYVDVCSSAPGKLKTTDLSIRTKRNETGHWVTVFDSYQEPNDSTEILDLDLKQTVFQCEEKEVVHVRGVLGGGNVKNVRFLHGGTRVSSKTENVMTEKLRFHSRVGKNAALSSDGTTAYRLNPGQTCCDAGVITQRTLRQNELFEVRLDNVTRRTGGSINIGVTTHHHNSIEFIRNMVDTSNGMWMMWGRNVIINGVKSKSGYGGDIEKMRSGDLLGVLKKANGELHLYINGVDQGIAATDLPYTVYGVLEVRGDTYQVSITENSSKILP